MTVEEIKLITQLYPNWPKLNLDTEEATKIRGKMYHCSITFFCEFFIIYKRIISKAFRLGIESFVKCRQYEYPGNTGHPRLGKFLMNYLLFAGAGRLFS